MTGSITLRSGRAASGEMSLKRDVSFGGNDSMPLSRGGSMAPKALWMALIDSALGRSVRTTPLRVACPIGRRLVQVARAGFQTDGLVASARQDRCRGPFGPSLSD